MSLTDKYGSPLSLFLSLSPKKRSAGAGVSTKPFEEALIVRLRSLLPIPDCSRSVPLLWLSRAVDLLSLTLADAVAIISDPSLSSTDRDALSSHLDSSVALLDACNAISAAADRILRGRLLVCFAIHLISSTPSPSPDLRRRAQSAISEWETVVSAPLSLSLCGSTDFIHRLKPMDPNRGRLTAVRRAIYAVEAISDLVARSSLAALGEKGDDILGIRRASGEFPWAPAYNEIVAAVSAKLYRGKRAGEIEVAELSVRRIAAAVEVYEDDGEKVTEELLRNAVRGAETAMEELTEGMDKLTNAVNQLFHTSLETRDAAVGCFRVGQGKCK